MIPRDPLERVNLFAAPWVIPVEGPPVQGGGLVVSGGRIRSVGRVSDLVRDWPEATRIDVDGCALVPALVNAHTHLELTALDPPLASGDFVGWVLGVIGCKRTAALETYREGILQGARACLEGGQALIADILSVAQAWQAYPSTGPEILVFPEVIAQQKHLAAAAVERALAAQASAVGSARFAGLSPHTPYTACAEAYRACRTEAIRRSGLLVTHLAESREELEFCLRRSGAIVDRLYARVPGEPPASPGVHPVEWLDRMGVLDRTTVLVHAVQMQTEHVALVARRGVRVVLCPRSNHRLGVGTAPGRLLLDAGVAVGLGTDSVLSAGDLDLWRDVVRAVGDYGWAPEEALRAATLGGARVLSQGRERGAFAAGLRADILAIPLASGRDLWDRVLVDANPAAVWLGGILRFQRPGFDFPCTSR